jgi:hypothetical protein
MRIIAVLMAVAVTILMWRILAGPPTRLAELILWGAVVLAFLREWVAVERRGRR